MEGSGSCDCFSDEYLLSLLGKGDEQAFTIIYQRYHKLLYVVAYKYLKNVFITIEQPKLIRNIRV